ncbi:hypothetical protein FGO68_gene12045 [Halteria grandinella]|uniref:Alpha/beta hydrolase fold-3 domain-containing protein n=1 Tax=Halteria grandinella TaxID=5974 RepID=A0A8J8P231_HALGN|nr:hypothetical protein FGO68_gene12045 [Halteria grandinella]
MSFCASSRIERPLSPAATKPLDKLIIHIHGGGFISMSSSSHQNYTRIWANETGVPIFSIDYRLSPKHQFPAALNDIWQVYYYLIERGAAEFGFGKVKKIVLAGDSAGGNLVAALTVLAIKRNYRKPDGIILSYPGLNITKFDFNPSFLLSLDDPILPYPFLKLCLESYSGCTTFTDAAITENPLVSPSKASDDILRQFPPTKMLVASNDPLRDDSFRFSLRLLKLGVPCEIKEFKLMPHGFLSLNFPMWGMPEESQAGIKMGTKWLREMLEIEHTQ